MDGKILTSVKHNRSYIHEWEFVDAVEETIRIYFKPSTTEDPETEGMGFAYYVVTWASSRGETDSIWTSKECYVECLFMGEARFDGMRHHYMGDEQTDNYGYIYYANLTHHIKVLEALRELEHKYCNDYDS